MYGVNWGKSKRLHQMLTYQYNFATMLSIGLGQEQQFTLILQTLQQSNNCAYRVTGMYLYIS